MLESELLRNFLVFLCWHCTEGKSFSIKDLNLLHECRKKVKPLRISLFAQECIGGKSVCDASLGTVLILSINYKEIQTIFLVYLCIL